MVYFFWDKIQLYAPYKFDSCNSKNSEYNKALRRAVERNEAICTMWGVGFMSELVLRLVPERMQQSHTNAVLQKGGETEER